MAFTLRLDDETSEALRALAADEGVSQQEVARRAIRDRARQSRLLDDVREAAERGASRYAALLDRLSR